MDIVERLEELSRWLVKNDVDMAMPEGMIDPKDAAAEIERLRAENEKMRLALEPFVRIANEIEECASQMVPGTPEADPNNWFKGCPWEDLFRARAALKGE